MDECLKKSEMIMKGCYNKKLMDEFKYICKRRPQDIDVLYENNLNVCLVNTDEMFKKISMAPGIKEGKKSGIDFKKNKEEIIKQALLPCGMINYGNNEIRLIDDDKYNKNCDSLLFVLMHEISHFKQFLEAQKKDIETAKKIKGKAEEDTEKFTDRLIKKGFLT